MSTPAPPTAIREALGSATYTITFDIHTDAGHLTNYTDQYLATLWHIAQANPVEFGEVAAGELVEKLGREIIRRWLASVPPDLWHHQGRDHLHAKAMREHAAAARVAA